MIKQPILILLVVVLSIFFTAARADAKNFIIHKVKRGETLWRIARMYGVRVNEVKQWNRHYARFIYPGQELKIFPRPRKAVASFYGYERKNVFHGRTMANGETFDKNDPSIVAHKFLPLNSIIKVFRGDKELVVIVRDRGPFVKGRDFDFSRAGALKLGFQKDGVAKIKYLVLSTPY